MIKFSQDQYRLGAGWRDFVIANEIKKRDAVLFTRAYGLDEETVYKIRIYKALD